MLPPDCCSQWGWCGNACDENRLCQIPPPPTGTNARSDPEPTLTPDYWFEGCYISTGGEFMSGITQSFLGRNSRSACFLHCNNLNYAYFGLKNDDCICSNTLGTRKRFNVCTCTSVCSGERTETCGANDRMQVYRIN